MKIISRYILKHFLPVFVIALVGFVGLYLVIDFFEKVDDILEKQISFLITWSYFLYKVPFIMAQGIPMASLLATLVSLGILNRNRELLALKASGMSPFMYAGPIVVMALILSVIDFGLGESIARSLNQKAQKIWQYKIKRESPSVGWTKENVWYRGENLIYQIRLYNEQAQVLEKVSLFYLNSEFKLTQRLDAKRLRWEGHRWIAEEGVVLTFKGSLTDQEPFTEKELRLTERPEDFLGIETLPEELGWFDLHSYAQKVRQEGYNATPYEVELHLRVAFPLTTLILSLLGIAVALRQGLHGGIALGVGIALIIAFLYLTVLQVGSSLAIAGILSPLLGVWAGNVIFAVGGVYLWMVAPQ